MNNPSPLIPQGSLLEQKSKGRARFRAAIFSVLAAHGVILIALLMLQGCRKETPPEPTAPETVTNAAPTTPDTNAAPATADTNAQNMAAASNTAPPPAPLPPTPAPAPVPPAEPPAAAATTEYTVVKGDYPAAIAKKNGISVAALMSANPGLDPKKLKVGQKLQLPVAGTGSSVANPGSAPAPTGEPAAAPQTYTVKSGDSLTKIASAHHVSVKALRAANKLKTDKIAVGQKLKIPVKASASTSVAPVAPTPAPEAPAPVPPAPTTAAPVNPSGR